MNIIACCLLAALGVANHEKAFAFQSTPQIYHRTTPITSNNAVSSSFHHQLSAASVDDTKSVDVPEYEKLGLPARPGRTLKIAIAGGGVGGLTAALYMLKKVRPCGICSFSPFGGVGAMNGFRVNTHILFCWTHILLLLYCSIFCYRPLNPLILQSKGL